MLTWQDCKFHGHSDQAGLVITWRADSSRWNVTAPSGRNLTKGVSVTQYRMYGGELTGDNGPLITLDMGDAPTNGGDFAAFGTIHTAETHAHLHTCRQTRIHTCICFHILCRSYVISAMHILHMGCSEQVRILQLLVTTSQQWRLPGPGTISYWTAAATR